MVRRDPLRYFRVEARELLEGLNQGVLELERGKGDAQTVQQLLRLAHTLKGAARVVHQAGLADLAHRLEDVLRPSEGLGVEALAFESLAVLLREMGRSVDALGGKGPETPTGDPGSAPVAEISSGTADRLPREDPLFSAAVSGAVARQDTVRLEMADLDALLNRLREAGTCLDVCAQWTEDLQRARRLAQVLASGASATAQDGARELAACLESVDRQGDVLERARRELAEAHEQAVHLRLQPASALFDYLERVTRDAARSLGRRVRFEADGGAQRLDAAVLASLQEALQHLVRNAVVHGIEEPSERIAKGKPAEGLVRLNLERRAGFLRVVVEDDGRGIQAGKVGQEAFKRGMLTQIQADGLDSRTAVRLLLKGGLSTAADLSELSGRGLGLDASRAQAERLGGNLDLRDRPGGGTEAEWIVPDSLASFETLALESQGRPALVPFAAVRELFVLDPGALVQGPEGDVVARPQGLFPYLALASLLNVPENLVRRPSLGLLLRCAGGEAVLGVDRVQGLRGSVVQPQPE
ncbi:MAG: chemotaxis protein CheA, partial [bacterium]